MSVCGEHQYLFLTLIICHIVTLLLLVLSGKVFQETTEALDFNKDSPKAYLAHVIFLKSQAHQMGCLKMIIKLNEINPKNYCYGIG